MSIPSTIRSVKRSSKGDFRRSLPALLLVLVGAMLLCLPFVSCHSSDAGDVYVLAFKLDSTKVGKFDSVRVEIFNGKPPGPGDTTKPVQVKVITTKGVTEVKLELSDKVKKDFSVVVTGFDANGVAVYRKQHTYENFAGDDKLPSVLLLSRIEAAPLTLSIGETRVPALNLLPAEAGDKRTFLTSDAPTKVLVVGDSLKGLAAGTANVTAATADGGVSATFLVTVTAVRVIDVQSKDLSLKLGETALPEVTVLPANASDKGYGLESSDPGVVEVTAKSLKGLKVGNAKVIIASNDGGAKDTITVDVRLPVKNLAAAELSVEVGDSFVPDLTWDPADATDKRFTLVSKDTSKVRVTANGDSLLAMSAGIDTVRATSRDGAFTASFKVTVAAKFFKVKSVVGKDLRGVPFDTLNPDLTWDPVFATEQGFSLKSLDTGKVAVLGKRMRLLAVGTAKVVLQTVDGGLTDTFDITVENPNFQSDILPITSFKCAPCHTPPATFNWTDSLQLIRKGVSALDRLTRSESAIGHMPLTGSANGQLNPRDLAVMLNWLSRVAVPLASITARDTVVNMGDTVTPAILFTPANASNQVFTLATGDSTVASLNGDRFIAVAAGNTTIFVTTDEASLKAQIKVKVNPPAFEKNVLPIIKIKCFPCHKAGTTFNWQDSTALLSDGSAAIDRLTRPLDAVGHMPLEGAQNGEPTATELKILLGWLESKVVPLKGITVPNDSIPVGSSKPPAILWTPANATNQSYILLSTDTSKVGVLGTDMVGKAIGSATVEVRAIDGNFSKFITVKVLPIPVDTLVVRDTAGAIGDTLTISPIFTPANATNQAFTLAVISHNLKVKVDSGVKLIGLALGKDTVEATSTDGSKKTRFVFTGGPVPPKSISVPDTNGIVGNKVIPRFIWNPVTTTNKAYTLSIPGPDTAVAAVRGDTILCKAVGQVAVVTATSTADPTVKATFKFTVGPVRVTSFTIAAKTSNIGITLTPAITWNPTNATNKNYSLSLLAVDTSKFSVTGSGTTLLTRHLGTGTITVTSLDSNKTSAWTVNVIRTSFTSNLKGITTFKCGACHVPPTPPATTSNPPNWQDSATVVSFAASIKTRINLPVSNSLHMPQGGPMLNSDTLTIIENWLNQN